MELKKYILPLSRWWWLIAATTLVAAAASFLATLRQPPIYQAITTLMIGRAIMDPNPTSNEFYLSQQLASNYAEIANREPVRNATMQALDLKWLPNYLARAVPEGQFIEILVTDTNPQRAQAVANELAHQLVLRAPTSAGPEEQNRREFVNRQLDTLEEQIEKTEAEITRLQDELGNMVSARQIADTQGQIAALQTKLTTLQGNYANLLANTESGAINTLSVIEPAALPTRPIGPNKGMAILLASAIGFTLSAGAAYLLEYLDDTLKTNEDVVRVTQSPIIGYLAEVNGEGDYRIYVAENPRHPIVEAYRTLRTNLEFAAVDRPLKTIFIASAEAEEGKSSVAANLAVAMAQGEKAVVLLDADLRKPNIHNFFGMQNDYGLSDVFRGRLSIDDAMKGWKGDQVTVITAGTPPPNPTELLGSKKMDQILSRLEEVADVVVIDGPPFIVADAAVLAAKVDGVLLVIRSGFTHEASVRAMMEQAERAGAHLVGVALNRIPRKGRGYYDGNRYYSSYYTSGRTAKSEAPGKARAHRSQVWQRLFDSLLGRETPVNVKRSSRLGEVDAAKRDGD